MREQNFQCQNKLCFGQTYVDYLGPKYLNLIPLNVFKNEFCTTKNPLDTKQQFKYGNFQYQTENFCMNKKQNTIVIIIVIFNFF